MYGVQCPGPWGTVHRVCAEFLGLASNRCGPGQGWEYRGKCALRQQPWIKAKRRVRGKHTTPFESSVCIYYKKYLYLNQVVHNGHRQYDTHKCRSAPGDNHQCGYNSDYDWEKSGQVVRDHVVDHVCILTKAVEYASHGRGVEERHRGTEDVGEKLSVEWFCGPERSKGQ